MKGRLITLEGGEGAGKSTLMDGLRVHLRSHGIDPLMVREPGGTSLGERVRETLLDPDLHDEICAEAELLMMFAARAQLVHACILPALSAGRWVLSDRFTDASYAYQGAGRGQPRERIAALERWAAAGLQPDLTLLLDVPVATGRRRAEGRGELADRIEREQASFFERVRAAYLERAAAEPGRIHVLDATRTPASVLETAVRAMQPLLDEAGP